MLRYQIDRIVKIACLLVQIARAQTKIDACLLTFDRQRDSTRERRCERLRAAHPAETGGQDPATRPIAAKVQTTGLCKRFVSSLNDALAADINPAACRHLSVHEQTLAVELVEVLPIGPLRHQVGVGDQHARRIGVRFEHADRFA